MYPWAQYAGVSTPISVHCRVQFFNFNVLPVRYNIDGKVQFGVALGHHAPPEVGAHVSVDLHVAHVRVAHRFYSDGTDVARPARVLSQWNEFVLPGWGELREWRFHCTHCMSSTSHESTVEKLTWSDCACCHQAY